MYIPKRYGESKLEECPFCGKQAMTVNAQKIPVCLAHKASVLDDMKCVCGEYLETKVGKFGLYFSCMRCGNIPLRRVLEINKTTPGMAKADSAAGAPKAYAENRKPKEITIRSDDPFYLS